uniref:Hematopoietic cell-specific Lyn substrate 1 n=1 Tax=Terrapene triunguis TaxID=2587831 RepID=A0A674J5Z9_9SAUR
MWKAAVGHNVAVKEESQGDDWDTDPDFVNDISERDQRWGAKTIEGSGRAKHINLQSQVCQMGDSQGCGGGSQVTVTCLCTNTNLQSLPGGP